MNNNSWPQLLSNKNSNLVVNLYEYRNGYSDILSVIQQSWDDNMQLICFSCFPLCDEICFCSPLFTCAGVAERGGGGKHFHRLPKSGASTAVTARKSKDFTPSSSSSGSSNECDYYPSLRSNPWDADTTAQEAHTMHPADTIRASARYTHKCSASWQ